MVLWSTRRGYKRSLYKAWSRFMTRTAWVRWGKSNLLRKGTDLHETVISDLYPMPCCYRILQIPGTDSAMRTVRYRKVSALLEIDGWLEPISVSKIAKAFPKTNCDHQLVIPARKISKMGTIILTRSGSARVISISKAVKPACGGTLM